MLPSASTTTGGPNRSQLSIRQHKAKPYARPSQSQVSAPPAPEGSSPNSTPRRTSAGSSGQAGTPGGGIFFKLKGWFSGSGTPAKGKPTNQGSPLAVESDSSTPNKRERSPSPSGSDGNGSGGQGEQEGSRSRGRARSSKRPRRDSPTKSILNGKGGDRGQHGHVGFVPSRGGRGQVEDDGNESSSTADMAEPKSRYKSSGLAKSLTMSGMVAQSGHGAYNDPPLGMLTRSATHKDLSRNIGASTPGSGLKRSGTVASGLTLVQGARSGYLELGSPRRGPASASGSTIGRGESAGTPSRSNFNTSTARASSPSRYPDPHLYSLIGDNAEMKEQADALARLRQTSIGVGMGHGRDRRGLPMQVQAHLQGDARSRASPMRQSPFVPRSGSVLGQAGHTLHNSIPGSPFQPSPRAAAFRRSQSVQSLAGPSNFSPFKRPAPPGSMTGFDTEHDDHHMDTQQSPTRARGRSRMSATPGRMSVDPIERAPTRHLRGKSRSVLDDNMEGLESDQKGQGEGGNEADAIMHTLVALRDTRVGGHNRGASGSGSGIPATFSSRALRKEIFVPQPSPKVEDSKTGGKGLIKATMAPTKSSLGESSGVGGKIGSQREESAKARDSTNGSPGPYARRQRAEKSASVGLEQRVGRVLTPRAESNSRAESPRAEEDGPTVFPQIDFSKFASTVAPAPKPLDIQFSASARKITPSGATRSAVRSKTQSTARAPAPKVGRAGSRFGFDDTEEVEEGDGMPSASELAQASAKSSQAQSPFSGAPIGMDQQPAQTLTPQAPPIQAAASSTSHLVPGQAHQPRASSPLKTAPPISGFPDSPPPPRSMFAAATPSAGAVQTRSPFVFSGSPATPSSSADPVSSAAVPPSKPVFAFHPPSPAASVTGTSGSPAEAPGSTSFGNFFAKPPSANPAPPAPASTMSFANPLFAAPQKDLQIPAPPTKTLSLDFAKTAPPPSTVASSAQVLMQNPFSFTATPQAHIPLGPPSGQFTPVAEPSGRANLAAVPVGSSLFAAGATNGGIQNASPSHFPSTANAGNSFTFTPPQNTGNASNQIIPPKSTFTFGTPPAVNQAPAFQFGSGATTPTGATSPALASSGTSPFAFGAPPPASNMFSGSTPTQGAPHVTPFALNNPFAAPQTPQAQPGQPAQAQPFVFGSLANNVGTPTGGLAPFAFGGIPAAANTGFGGASGMQAGFNGGGLPSPGVDSDRGRTGSPAFNMGAADAPPGSPTGPRPIKGMRARRAR